MLASAFIDAVLEGKSPQALLSLFEFRKHPQSYYDEWLARQLPHLRNFVPNIERYWRELGDGFPRVLYGVDRWKFVGEFPHNSIQGVAIAKLLVDNVDTTRKTSPPPSPPKLLYRGLSKLDELPKPGQVAVYGTQGPASWTNNEETAQWYASSGKGAVLVANGSDVINSGDLFIWPFKHGPLGTLYPPGTLARGSSEWAVWIKRPIPLVRWFQPNVRW